MILANNCEWEIWPRVVSKQQGKELAKAHGFKFMEVSAKSNINIEEVWDKHI